MMDCKKALKECNGNVAEASDYLRKKGLAAAGKKAGRVASQGVIASYIHAGNRWVAQPCHQALYACFSCFACCRTGHTSCNMSCKNVLRMPVAFSSVYLRRTDRLRQCQVHVQDHGLQGSCSLLRQACISSTCELDM